MSQDSGSWLVRALSMRQLNASPLPPSQPNATMNALRLSAFAFVLTSTFACMPAFAQDTPASRQAAMERYLHVVPMAKMMEDTYSELAKQVPPEQRNEFVSAMRKLVSIDKIKNIAKQSMLRTFTTNELNALADFYSSEHGASAMRKLPAYTADIMPPLMQEIERAVLKLQSSKN